MCAYVKFSIQSALPLRYVEVALRTRLLTLHILSRIKLYIGLPLTILCRHESQTSNILFVLFLTKCIQMVFFPVFFPFLGMHDPHGHWQTCLQRVQPCNNWIHVTFFFRGSWILMGFMYSLSSLLFFYKITVTDS